MFGSELTAITLSLYALQVALLPTHLILFLSRKLDKTRLRFLLISLVFVGFNGLWIILHSYKDVFESDTILILFGIVLVVSVCIYLSKELNINLESKYLTKLIILSLILVSGRFLCVFEFYNTYVDVGKYLAYSLFQIVTLMLCIPLILKYFHKRKTDRRKPIFIAGIVTFYLILFTPIIALLFTEPFIKYLYFSLGYILLLWAYFSHYFMQAKFENSNNQSNGILNLNAYNELNLTDRYVISNDLFLEYDFNERELEVASLLVTGASYKEIAELLYLDYSTIRGYASRVYSKTGVYGSKKPENFRKKFGNPMN